MIMNYSTRISPAQTVAEITALLVRKGAKSITQDYGERGGIKAVSFVLAVGGLGTRFLLPANPSGVARVMLRDKPWRNSRNGSKGTYEQKVMEKAEWISWRILKDWVEAQIAMIESEQVEVAQVFMPYAIAQNGQTMYELFVESNAKQLGDGR
jgi:hypothetical protein